MAAAADLPVTLDDVLAAASAIRGQVERTPTLHSRTLSAICGCEVWLKFENLQFTASFKERGALNRLQQLTLDERKRGVIAMSAGNHAQGLAHHATRLGIPSTIVMPITTPNVKVRNTEALGARVVLFGDGFGEAATEAARMAEQEGYVWVPPYDDRAIIAGQGTVALELLADAPDLDAIVVPVGGGGLIAGMAVAACGVRPAIELVGVESELYPSMRAALDGTSPEIGGPTVAEGIAVPRAGELTLPIVRALVADVLVVPEASIEQAMNLLLDIEKTVVEGAGAAGLAAILHEPERFAGRKVGVVLCGGNVDARLLASVILRGLVRAGRLSRIAIDITDQPGALAQVAAVIAAERGDIVEVAHQRMFTALSVKSASLEVTVETRDRAHLDAIVNALDTAGHHARVLSDLDPIG